LEKMRIAITVILILALTACPLSTQLRSTPRLSAAVALALGLFVAVVANSSDFYDFAKDFQPVVAAAVALAAALMAYLFSHRIVAQ
jgi:hypothetical protein